MTSVKIGMKKPRKGDRQSESEVKLLERYEFLKEFNLAPKIAPTTFTIVQEEAILVKELSTTVLNIML